MACKAIDKKRRLASTALLAVYVSLLCMSFVHVHSGSSLSSEYGTYADAAEEFSADSHSCFICEFLSASYVEAKTFEPQGLYSVAYDVAMPLFSLVPATSDGSPCTIRGPCFS